MTISFLSDLRMDLDKLSLIKYSAFSGEFIFEADKNLRPILMEFIKNKNLDFIKEETITKLNTIYSNVTNKNTLVINHFQKYKMGRFFASSSSSIIGLSKHIKHTLLNHYGYMDLDMIKSNPSIICSLCKNLIQLPTLTKYIENPNDIFNELIEFYSVNNTLTQDHIKLYINSTIYGGSYNNWLKDMEDEGIELKTTEKHNIFIKLNEECKKVSSAIIEANPKLLEHLKIQKTNDNETIDEWKLNNSVLSYFLFSIENHILHICYKYLTTNKIIIPRKNVLLEYDGLCFKPTNQLTNSVLQDILLRLNEKVVKDTGLNVKFKIKKYDDAYIHQEVITEALINPINPNEPTNYDVDIENLINNVTDYDTAKYFCKLYGENYKCVDIKNKICYIFNENCLWERFDSGTFIREKLSNEFTEKFKNILIEIQEEISVFKDDSDVIDKLQIKQKHIVGLIKMLNTTTHKNNIVREIFDIIFDGNFEKELNKQSFIPIKCKKVIDLTTGEVFERTINHYYSYECPVNYVKDIPKDKYDYVDKYFLDLFCGNKEIKDIVINVLKSVFAGNRMRYVFFLIGKGSNGKSLLFNILSYIFKNSMDTLDTKVILKSKSSSNLTTEFEKLQYTKLGYITELKTTDILNTDILKKISGGDPIDYRGLYSKNATIEPETTIFALTNQMATCDEDDKAFLDDRCILFPFLNRFEINNNLLNELKENADYIFSYIANTGKIISKLDKETMPNEMKVAKQDYKDSNEKIDYLQNFIDETYMMGTDKDKVLQADFKNNYNEFLIAKKEHLNKLNDKAFTKLLREKYSINSKQSNSKNYYIGLKVKVYNCKDELDVESGDEK